MSIERYVFDTNVVVSALLFAESKPAQALFTALQRGVILTSLSALQELNAVLQRKKFDKYLTSDERELFLDQFTKTVIIVDIDETILACRDPRDDMFLEIAVNGAASFLITGDPDLLVLHPFRGISIITPDSFLKLATSPSPSEP